MRDPNPLLRRIKLSDLRLFSAVVGAGGMAKAATQLHISQPAVSKAIASLEQTLGVRLLDRHAGGVTPTIYGDALLQGSTAVFDDLGQSVGRIKFLNDPRTGKLRFACGQTYALGFVPGVIEKMKADYPGVRFDVFDVAEVASLKRRQIEVAITRQSTDFDDPDIHEEALFEDPVVVYAASDSPWATTSQDVAGRSHRRALDPSPLQLPHWPIKSWSPSRQAASNRPRLASKLSRSILFSGCWQRAGTSPLARDPC